MILYHSTTEAAAASILADGWVGGSGSYGFAATELSGVVFLASRPLDEQDGAAGDVLLSVDVGKHDLSEYEIVEEMKPWSEYAIPASHLNEIGQVARVIPPDL